MVDTVAKIQPKIDVPTWVRFLAGLDLSRLADEFVARLVPDARAALAFWNAALPFVPQQLRLAAGRLVDARLDLGRRGVLWQCDGGNQFLFERMIERKLRPSMPTVPLFTPSLAYDNYASLVTNFGSTLAKEAVLARKLVLLALRNESSTLAHKGRGSYDDQIVALNGLGAPRHPWIFPACTEPGAQYSQRASTRTVAHGRVDARYAGVAFSKAEGADVDHDGVKDLGRLIAGTYQYFEKPGGFLKARAFHVKIAQRVERDSDGDGFFNTLDANRIDAGGAGTSMYIHQGGADTDRVPNTWSAGCQTIPKNHFARFLSVVGHPRSFYYVLLNMNSP